jgi:photosystem II protein PsbQ
MDRILHVNWASKLVATLLVVVMGLEIGVGMPAGATVGDPPLQQLEAQVESLQTLVDAQDWLEIRSYIHGPMGMVRKDLVGVAQGLQPTQKDAFLGGVRKLAKSLEKLDQSAATFDAGKVKTAQQGVQSALADLERIAS